MIYFSFSDMHNKDKQGRKNFKPAVDTYTLERQDMYRRISLFGQTVSEASVDIAPKYAGKIMDVKVKLGDRVQAGQVLLVQDTKDLELSIQQNNAAIHQAEADVMEAEATYQATYYKVNANFERLKQNDERYQALYEQGAVSKEAYDSVHQEVVDAQAALDILRNQTMIGEVPASVETKRAALAKSQSGTEALAKQRSDMILIAPRDGVIGYRNAEVGAIASAGQKVFSLVDNSKIYVDCQLSEQDIAAVKTGLKLQFNVESLGNTYEGTIIYVSPAVDATTKSYIARIALDRVDDVIKAGMFARTQLKVLQRPQTLFVPKDGVVEKNGKTSIFVVKEDNTVEERQIKTGLTNDTEIEILEGLQEGERIAISNLARLKTGVEVDLADSAQGEK